MKLLLKCSHDEWNINEREESSSLWLALMQCFLHYTRLDYYYYFCRFFWLCEMRALITNEKCCFKLVGLLTQPLSLSIYLRLRWLLCGENKIFIWIPFWYCCLASSTNYPEAFILSANHFTLFVSYITVYANRDKKQCQLVKEKQCFNCNTTESLYKYFLHYKLMKTIVSFYWVRKTYFLRSEIKEKL